MMDNKEKKIGIIGLGYVGLPLALEFGKTRSVVGYDLDKQRILELCSNTDRTMERSAKELRASKFLEYTSEINNLKDCQIFIITVPTPIDDVNRPDLSFIINASKSVAAILKAGDIIIYESTVYPGCTEEICVPLLESGSNLKFNIDFFCGYSPERINPGDKVNTLTKIPKITSGSNQNIASEVDILYKSIITAGTYLAPSIKVAEAAKVIENTQRDLNIALVNELSLIFNKLNIDTLEVLEAAGSKWNFLPFKPGLVGGHCIGVDPYYLTHKAEQIGHHPEIILSGRKINDSMASYVAQKTLQKMLKNNIDVTKSKVGILGLTFKENCPDTRNSKVVDIIKELKKWNIEVVIDDPWADYDDIKKFYGLEISKISSENPVTSLIVAVGHNEYRELSPHQLRSYCNVTNPVLADVKSIYKPTELESCGFTVFRL